MALAALKSFIQFYRDTVARIKSCCQSIYNQRFTLAAILILCVVYKYLPCVFSFLISCSPIFICTAVLLHTLLSFGRPNDAHGEDTHVKEKEKPHETPPLSARRLQKRNNISSDFSLRKRNEIRERALEKSGIPLASKPSSNREKKVVFSPIGETEIPHASSSSLDTKEKSPEKEIDEVDDVETSSFGSDRAECSSPDSNVLPVIDETNPLLELKPPQLPLTSGEESDAVLESSDRSIDGSVDSEAENQEGSQGNEDGSGGGKKPLVSWTEDDEKNLMDLGTSELERNQRLESLIAKRRARKSVVEKNLIDFDSTDNAPVPSIKPLKSNPFDLPFTSSEIDGLPPIPGSAPSVLVPRGNPFDLPYDPQEEKPNLTEDSFQQEFTSVFCRHESFSFGPTFMDKYNSKFTPFFGGEGATSQGNAYPARNSVFESLPPIDRKNRKKQMERVLSLGVYPTSHYQQERRIPEIDFFKPYQDLKRDYEPNKIETKEVGQELGVQNKKEEAFMEPEVVKEEVPDVKHEESPSTDPISADESKEESDSNSNLNESAMEGVDDDPAKEPVYDSSPSAVEKRTIDEYLTYSDKSQILTSCSSIASDMQVEVSEAGSPRESLERYSYSDGESSFQDGIDRNAIESRDRSIDEKELRPLEENENGEYVFSSPLPPVPEALEEDHMDLTPPCTPKPDTHFEVHEPDLVSVDSMAPSSSMELDKGGMVQEEQVSDSGQSEEHQEENVKTIEEAYVQNANVENTEEIKEDENSISNQNIEVNQPEPEDSEANVEESSGVPENTEVPASPPKPLEAATTSGEESDESIKTMQETDVQNVMVEESNGSHEEATEVPVSSSKSTEATTTSAKEHNESHETIEAPVNPLESTMDNVVENNEYHENTEVVINTSQPIEATPENVDESNDEAAIVDEERKAHEENKDTETSQMENKIESDTNDATIEVQKL
ncbi:hypothetical protein ACHQM5_020987 [Ranunculus cassubicifolius]